MLFRMYSIPPKGLIFCFARRECIVRGPISKDLFRASGSSEVIRFISAFVASSRRSQIIKDKRSNRERTGAEEKRFSPSFLGLGLIFRLGARRKRPPRPVAIEKKKRGVVCSCVYLAITKRGHHHTIKT